MLYTTRNKTGPDWAVTVSPIPGNMESVRFCLIALDIAEEVQGFRGASANSIYTGGPGPGFQVKRWRDRGKNKALVNLIIKAARARFFNAPRKHEKALAAAKKYFENSWW